MDDLCPICGSEMIDMSNIPFPHLDCPKCGSIEVGSLFDVDILEKHGSKVVMKRSVESVILDCVCECCGHKWSVCCLFKDGKLIGYKRRL